MVAPSPNMATTRVKGPTMASTFSRRRRKAAHATNGKSIQNTKVEVSGGSHDKVVDCAGSSTSSSTSSSSKAQNNHNSRSKQHRSLLNIGTATHKAGETQLSPLDLTMVTLTDESNATTATNPSRDGDSPTKQQHQRRTLTNGDVTMVGDRPDNNDNINSNDNDDTAEARDGQRRKRSLFGRRRRQSGSTTPQSASPITSLGAMLRRAARRSPLLKKQRQHQQKQKQKQQQDADSNNGNSGQTVFNADANTVEDKDVAASVNTDTTESTVAMGNSTTVDRTTIITEAVTPMRHEHSHYGIEHTNSLDSEQLRRPLQLERQLTPVYNCSSTMLHHPCFIGICAKPDSVDIDNEHSVHAFNEARSNALMQLPEDPTVQESIECIFASHATGGGDLWAQHPSDEEEEEEEDDVHAPNQADMNARRNAVGIVDDSETDAEYDMPLNDCKPFYVHGSQLVSPSVMLQSKHLRSDRQIQTVEMMNAKQLMRRQQTAPITPEKMSPPASPERSVGSDSRDMSTVNDDAHTVATVAAECMSPQPCRCGSSKLPTADPSKWPQSPLMMRPTPGSGTIVKGVRFTDSSEYFWEPGPTTFDDRSWPQVLVEQWDAKSNANAGTKQAPADPAIANAMNKCTFNNSCPRCCIVPINNGNEERGEAIAIDFESEIFDGSIVVRIRHSNGTTPQPYDDSKGYFEGMNRRYHTVVRGRFKKRIPWSQLVSGYQLDRPCGRLPSKWILKGGTKVVGFFAPQLDVKYDCKEPYSFTPLGSTPQSITVETQPNTLMDDAHEEPKEPHRTLMGEAHSVPTSMQRSRARKKAFDKVYVHRNESLCTDPDRIYTFEFLQHLFNFQDFSVELGNMLGSVALGGVLDGQPFQVMAMHQASASAPKGNKTPIWSFDLWHKCLWEAAVRHDEIARSGKIDVKRVKSK